MCVHLGAGTASHRPHRPRCDPPPATAAQRGYPAHLVDRETDFFLQGAKGIQDHAEPGPVDHVSQAAAGNQCLPWVESHKFTMITITAMGETKLFDDLPSFDRPPVVEVAVGVHFLQLPGLTAVALVRLVDDLWRNRYPRIVEQPAAPPLSAPGTAPMMAFQLQTGSPPMRLWSLTEDETLLIQVQRDRLLLNWRKVKDDDPYPRYKRLRGEFAEVWREFSDYVGDRDYGVLQPSVAEVTFFNRVPMASAAEISTFVEALNPEWSLGGQLATAYQLEREITDLLPVGHQNIALNYRPENKDMQLEITTQIDVDTATGEVSEVLDSLDTAHRYGVLTFDTVTTRSAHSAWGRHDAGNS